MKCGLAAARMESFAKESDEAVPDVLHKAWAHALEAWEDTARHDELIRLVSQNDAYAWAAGRYRTRPDAVGTRQLERVRKAAEATLLSMAATRKASAPSPYRNTTMLMIALVLLAVGGLIYAMVRNRAPTATPSSITPTTK
jgi:hypothetical protein